MGDLLTKVRLVNIPDGSSNLTKATFTGLTPDRFQNMATTAYSEARLLAEAAESYAVGIVAKPLDELLLSRIKEVDKSALMEKKLPGAQSIILPYTYRKRKANLPADDFVVTAGVVSPNAGSTVNGIVFPTSSWNLNVKFSVKWGATFIGSAKYSYLARMFLKGDYIYVEYVNKTGTIGLDRDTRLTAFKVINAVDVDADNATVTVAPCITDATWGGYSAGQKGVYQPDHGYIHSGVNSVHDQEAYAQNQASDLSASLIVDWQQVSRYTQYYNDVYADTLKRVIGGEINDYQTVFANLPLAEQNKQQFARYRRKFLNSVFYGQAINENQTVEGYNALPQVVDPDDGTLYGYKSNALGLRTLLQAESQVVDVHAGTLDLKLLFDMCWKTKRNREALGQSHEVICVMTDKDTARDIDIQILTACKNLYGETVSRYYEKGEIRGNDGEHRYTFKKYDLPGYDFQLAVFIEPFLTDRLYHFGKGTGGTEGSVDFQSVGRAIWGIDWNDFNVGIVSTNSAKREYRGEVYSNANALYATVITPNTKHYDLRSTTWTTQIGDAKRSFMFENFSGVATLTL